MKKLIAVALAGCLTGCVSVTSFVDPSFARIEHEDIPRRADPYRWLVLTQFQRKGEPVPAAAILVQDSVEQALRASGLAVPAKNDSGGRLNVVVNNTGDRGASVAKGIGTGLTSGLARSYVTDAYEMTATLDMAGTVTKRAGYRHAIQSAVGSIAPPDEGGMTPEAAFNRMVDQMMLRFLKDLLDDGILAAPASVAMGLGPPGKPPL